MLFIEESSPPPFYQPQLSDSERKQLDKWFIGKRSQSYYLKRFEQFDKQGYLSAKWNWASFFATFGWLLYRKRYLDAIVYTVAGWSFIHVNITIFLVAFEFIFMQFVPYAYQFFVRIGIAAAIWLFWAVMVARWSDAYYYRMARREIADVVTDYPRDLATQKEHLEREGGVSIIGLGMALTFFALVLLIIQVQFLPLYAKPKEKVIIQQAYEVTQVAALQVENRYIRDLHCPVDLPLNTRELNLDLQVATQSEAVTNKNSPCMVIATIRDVPFPNRNLNYQKIIMYRDSSGTNAKWYCITSFNKKKTPAGCVSN